MGAGGAGSQWSVCEGLMGCLELSAGREDKREELLPKTKHVYLHIFLTSSPPVWKLTSQYTSSPFSPLGRQRAMQMGGALDVK